MRDITKIYYCFFISITTVATVENESIVQEEMEFEDDEDNFEDGDKWTVWPGRVWRKKNVLNCNIMHIVTLEDILQNIIRQSWLRCNHDALLL